MSPGFRARMRRLADLFSWRRRRSGEFPVPAAASAAGSTKRMSRRKKRKRKQEELARQARQAHQEPQQTQQAQQEQEPEQVHQVHQAQQAQQAQHLQQNPPTPAAQQGQEQARGEEAELQGDSSDSCECRASRAAARSSSCSDTEPEDEVFLDDVSLSLVLPATQTPPRRSQRDDYHAYDPYVYGDCAAHTHSFPGRRRHSRTLPAILVEGQPLQEGGHARHSSDSQAAFSQTRVPPPSPPPPPRVPEVMFDEQAAAAAARAVPASPFFSTRRAPFTVKYTKVYGEADGAYRNDSRPRGLVFVCNFKLFDDNKYSSREGSEKDFENLVSLFAQMGYNIEHRRRRYCLTGHVTREEFLQRLGEFAAEVKHTLLCSCVVILMSHGTGPRTFVTSDNLKVDLLDVYKIFDNINCPNLKDKPKIFILQFCRGEEPSAAAAAAGLGQGAPPPGSPGAAGRRLVSSEVLERMVKRHVSIVLRDILRERPALLASGEGGDGHLLQRIKQHSRAASLASLTSSILEAEDNENCQDGGGGCESPRRYEADTSVVAALPAAGLQRYSDMYSIFSTSPGELSHRHPTRGSLLIQAICHVFAEYAYQDDIDTLVRRVSTYMTKTLQRDDPVTVPRQTCERTNNGLDKPFYFNPYETPQHRQLTI